ncbi:MAG TPA: hypothetical protein VF535_08735 [Allosphingosinicella sp.]|jgi:hypothetical protein
MMFVSRGGYDEGLAGFVDFILIRFFAPCPIASGRDERERRAQQGRAEQQGRDAETRVRTGPDWNFDRGRALEKPDGPHDEGLIGRIEPAGAGFDRIGLAPAR